MSKGKRYWLSCDGDFYDKELDKVFFQQSIEDLLNQLDQENQELKKQLKNAIVPKFKIGQEVWFINYFSDCGYRVDCGKVVEIKINEYDKTLYEIAYKYKCELDFKSRKYTNVFATKEEAEVRLKEIKGNE